MNPPQNLESADADLFGVSPPEHGVLGRALIVLIHCIIPAAGIVALIVRPWERGDRADMVVAGVVFLLWGAYVAECLRRFECWAWFFVMPLLLAVTVLPLLAMGAAAFILIRGGTPPSEVLGYGGLSIPLVAWIHYLWSRRWDFWSDPPSRARRRPERRWVTPEWRAARLARLGSVATSPRVKGARPPAR